MNLSDTSRSCWDSWDSSIAACSVWFAASWVRLVVLAYEAGLAVPGAGA